MYFRSLLALASFTSVVVGQSGNSTFEEYTIEAEGITAKFIHYGARLTSLLVADRDGNEQDVALGYDDPAQYITDTETNHTYFGQSLYYCSSALLMKDRTHCWTIRESYSKRNF